MNEQGEGLASGLAPPEQDAQGLALLSESQGFTSRMLLGEDATAENVIESLQFASMLGSGDALVVSFSGFGSQVRPVPSRRRISMRPGASTTASSSTTAYACWAKFKPGVRILLLSDCCHNEKVARRPMFAAVSNKAVRGRLLPDAEQRATYARHQRLHMMIFNASILTVNT